MPCLQGIEALPALWIWRLLSCLRAVGPEPRVLLQGEGAPTAKVYEVSSLAASIGSYPPAHLPRTQQKAIELEDKARGFFILSKPARTDNQSRLSGQSA